MRKLVPCLTLAAALCMLVLPVVRAFAAFTKKCCRATLFVPDGGGASSVQCSGDCMNGNGCTFSGYCHSASAGIGHFYCLCASETDSCRTEAAYLPVVHIDCVDQSCDTLCDMAGGFQVADGGIYFFCWCH